MPHWVAGCRAEADGAAEIGTAFGLVGLADAVRGEAERSGGAAIGRGHGAAAGRRAGTRHRSAAGRAGRGRAAARASIWRRSCRPRCTDAYLGRNGRRTGRRPRATRGHAAAAGRSRRWRGGPSSSRSGRRRSRRRHRPRHRSGCWPGNCRRAGPTVAPAAAPTAAPVPVRDAGLAVDGAAGGQQRHGGHCGGNRGLAHR